MSQSAIPDDLFPFIFMLKKEARKCLKERHLIICSHLFLCSKKRRVNVSKCDTWWFVPIYFYVQKRGAYKCLKVWHLMICSHLFLCSKKRRVNVSECDAWWFAFPITVSSIMGIYFTANGTWTAFRVAFRQTLPWHPAFGGLIFP